MALKYTTLAKLNEYLGTSGVDALVTSIGESAEALFDTLIGTTLESSSRTQYFPVGYTECVYEEGRVFYLYGNNITAVATVNGVSAGTINVDYTIETQKLELKNGVNRPSAFPYRYTVVYTAGYTTIPNDVISAINMLSNAMYKGKDIDAVGGYRQDLLQVDFKDSGLIQKIMDSNDGHILQSVINKYKVHSVII